MSSQSDFSQDMSSLSGPSPEGLVPVITPIHATAREAGGYLNAAVGLNPSGDLMSAITDGDTGTTYSIGGLRTGTPDESGIAGSWADDRILLAGHYGTVTLNRDGTWTYSVDNDNPAVEALRLGQTLVENFTFDIVGNGGSMEVFSGALDVTIQGADDLARVISAMPDSFTARANQDTQIDLAQISLVDPDGGGETYFLGLVASLGTLWTDPHAGISISGNGSGVIVVYGTAAALNDWLTAELLVYRAPADRTSGSTTLTISLLPPTGAGYQIVSTPVITFAPAEVATAPVVDLNGIGASFDTSLVAMTIGSANKPLSAIQIQDADSTSLTQAKVVLSVSPLGNDSKANDFLSLSQSARNLALNNGLTIDYGQSEFSYSLTLNGTASIEVYQQILSEVVYSHTNRDRIDGTRQLSVRLTDDNGQVSGGTEVVLIEPNAAVQVGQRIIVDGVNSGQLVSQVIDANRFIASGPLDGLYGGASLAFYTGHSQITTARSATDGHARVTIDLEGYLYADLNGSALDGVNNEILYTEGWGAMPLAATDVTVNNGDSDISAIRVSLANPVDNDDARLEFLLIRASSLTILSGHGIHVQTHNGRYDGIGNLVDVTELTLYAPGNVNAATGALALGLLAYVNTSKSPSPVTREIDIQMTDKLGIAGATTTTLVTPVPLNDAPSVTASGSAEFLAFAMSEVVLFTPGTIAITDPDAGSMLTQAEVKIIGAPDGTAETITHSGATFETSRGTVLTLSGNGTLSNRLVISGPGSHADYIEVLESLKYVNSSAQPTAGGREVHISVQDDGNLSSNAATFPVTVAIAPVVDLNGVSLAGVDHEFTFIEQDGPTPIASPDATIADNSVPVVRMLVTLGGVVNGPDEELQIDGAVIADLELAGVTIIRMGAHQILMTGAPGIDASVYERGLRAITYSNTSYRPTDASRTVTVDIENADGKVGRAATTEIRVVPVNQPATGTLELDWSGKAWRPAAVGDRLSLTGSYFDKDGQNAVNYQEWWVDGSLAATAGSYTIQAADAGKRIELRLRFTDFEGNPETLLVPLPELVTVRILLPDGGGTALGAAGDDYLVGGTGNDTLEGAAGNDELSGQAGDDWIYGNEGDDTLAGGSGNDWMHGGKQNDVLYGGHGNDTLGGGLGDDLIDGGDGIDTATYQHAREGVTVDLGLQGQGQQVGTTEGNDTLIGIENLISSAHSDLLTGDGNDNRLEGLNGNETLMGDGGNDWLYGNQGDDWLEGGAGDDWMHGGQQNDVLYGGHGNDTLGGGLGDDLIDGGDGIDTATYLHAREGVTVDLGLQGQGQQVGTTEGNDTLTGIENLIGSSHSDLMTGDGNNNRIEGLNGNDTLAGGYGRDTLMGDGGNDWLYGNQGDDWLEGGAGDDWLHGGQNDDALFGGSGNDTLTGGLGNDTLTGGSGADVFVFERHIGTGVDIITDFVQGVDRIGLRAEIASMVRATGHPLAEVMMWDAESGELSLDLASGVLQLAKLTNVPGLVLTVDDLLLM